MILPVKERDSRRAVFERLAKRQAAETRAQNDNVGILGFHLGDNLKCVVDKSKSCFADKVRCRILRSLRINFVLLALSSHLFNWCPSSGAGGSGFDEDGPDSWGEHPISRTQPVG